MAAKRPEDLLYAVILMRAKRAEDPAFVSRGYYETAEKQLPAADKHGLSTDRH